MHRGMSRQTLQTLAHIDQFLYLFIRFIQFPEFRVEFQCPVQCDIELVRHHLGNGIHITVRQIHHPADIADHALGRQRTECDNLHHLVRSIFSAHVIDHFLTSLVTEIDIDIGHGHTLRIEEALKQQIVADGVDIRDLQAIRHDTTRCTSSSGSHHDLVLSGIIDKIPHNQEVIHISHIPDNAQLIVKSLPKRHADLSLNALLIGIMIPLLQSFRAQFVKIRPGSIALRHFELRQLRHAELDLHMTPVRDPLRILHSLPRIGKEAFHLLLTLDEILTALVAHTVLIRQFLAGLQTQQDIVRLHIVRIGIMDIICDNERNIEFLAHLQKHRIDSPLLRNAVILHFQEKIALSEARFIFESHLLCLIHETFDDIALHFSRQAG